MMQLVRGSTNQHSVLYPHSLLEHMYGPYTAVGSISSSTVNSVAGNAILEFSANLSPADPNFTLNSSLLGYDGYLEGCVITMTSGQAKGLTSRIVRYDATASPPVYHVLAFNGGAVVPSKNDTFIINGRAFSGTGFGYSGASGFDNALDANNRPFALLPNPVFYNYKGSTDWDPAANAQYATQYPNNPNGIPFGGIGGGNTDYDAPDYQHMFMSWSVIGASGLPQTILPSFHRPDLINYWATNAGITDWNSNPDLLRKIMLRPNPIDHPNFTGGNLLWSASTSVNLGWQLAMTGRDAAGNFISPWDVDNDGDGVADSVWVDAGYPVQAAADGKLYKPLFAILCVDLDGRLNVNAAGTTEMLPPSSSYTQSTHAEQFIGAAYTGSSAPSGSLAYFQGPFAGTYNGNPNPPAMPFSLLRGEGLGTAENDLVQFYLEMLKESNTSLSTTQLAADALQASGYLMQGGTVNSVKYDGRYGDLNPTTNPSSAPPQAGVPGSPTLLGLIMRFQYPSNSFDPTTNNIFPLSSFGSPSDLWGRMAVGLDFSGQPLFWKPALAGSTGWAGELRNNPYDMNLSVGGTYQAYGSQSADNPFGVYDLERLLRPFDIDTAELPRRLWDLSGPGPLTANPTAYGFTSAQAQATILAMGHNMTTDSWDPPSPGVVAPAYLRNGGVLSPLYAVYGRNFATNIEELLSARLLKENPSWLLLPQATMQAQINANIRQLLSPELIAGLRMNINRPLGDGRDGNGNNVVDEVPPPGKYSSPPVYGPPWDNNTAELSTEGNNTLWSWLSNSLKGLTWSFSRSVPLDLVNGTDVNGDGVVDINDQIMARQLLARHLYVLARLMIDDTALQNVTWFSNETGLGPGGANTKEMAIRRIAQWAINVVDFMDPDNTMTPFEYDENPFTNDDPDPAGHPGKTWEVNGILNDASSPKPDDSSAWRRLVWGCERPELLLNETLAFHDRRVKDSTFDNGINSGGGNGHKVGDTPPDATNSFDQVRIPQGSAFFELYCTGNPNQPQQSGDLYQYDNTNKVWKLDLAKMAPADSSGTQYPVWRMAITGPDSNQKTTTNDVQTQVDPSQPNSHPASYSFDTANSSASLVAGVSITPPVIERVVWFANVDPASTGNTYDVPANQIYYRHDATKTNSPLLLGCGQYAVVGPRQVTRIGWTTNQNSDSTSVYAAGCEPACAKIELTPGLGGVLFSDQGYDANNNGKSVPNYPAASSIQQPLAIIAATDVTTAMNWSSASSPAAVLDTKDATAQIPHGIGISISEPLAGATYYQEPTVNRDPFDGESGVTDCYGRVDETDPSGTKLKFLDQPLDSQSGMPLKDNNALTTGTYLDYKTVLLQRLANPLIPYDAKTNPYLTVDWMPIDLTVFNGQAPNGSSTDPDETNNNMKTRFASRQRNGKLTGAEPSCISDFNLWFRGTQNLRANDFNPITGKPCTFDDPPQTAVNDNSSGIGSSKMVFPHELKYYNDGANPASNDLADASDGRPFLRIDTTKKGLHTFGFVDSYFQQPFGQTFGQATQTYGPLALSEVTTTYTQHVGDPRSPFPWLTWNNRPFENIAELMLVPATHPGRLLYEFGCNWTGANVYLGTNPNLQSFPHLLNFFNSAPPANSTNPNPGLLGLSQMFEYLQVPSPFVGTQEVLNPQTFRGDWWPGTPGEAPTGTEPAGTAGLHPPFNLVSNYRDPGKVNINTIPDTVDASGNVTGSAVWNAILGGDPTVAGNGVIGPPFSSVANSRRGYGTADVFDSAHPSIFSNPFRSGAAADMVPLASLAQSPAEATLFRDSDTNANVPLLMGTVPSANYNNGTRNPYFTYQGLERLTSKLTTRSNVYAVWITVGYFEVTPWYGISASGAPNTAGPQVFDTAHPDGYQLGEELGSDTGQVERHRAFYIIDRSIPVGFQRGYDNNANKAVLLKRFIE
jgi:hypothetical protein